MQEQLDQQQHTTARLTTTTIATTTSATSTTTIRSTTKHTTTRTTTTRRTAMRTRYNQLQAKIEENKDKSKIDVHVDQSFRIDSGLTEVLLFKIEDKLTLSPNQ